MALVRRNRPVNSQGVPLDIPMSPEDPRWAQRLPPPDPLPGGDEVAPAQVVASHPTVGLAKRVVISYGPKEERFMVSVEVAPDWDCEDGAIELGQVEVAAVAAVVKMLSIKIKNQTSMSFST